MSFKELLAKFGERWRALSQIQKGIAVLAATGVLVSLVILGQVLFGTTYAPLFTGLDPKDAGKISEELKKEKIPYKITNQGKTIEVPEKQVYETRIKLASSGALYSSGVGFELFDEKKFGVTEFEQQVGYQRALQEELRRTIVQVDAVEQARVHIVLPKKSLFLNDQSEPSASIALKLKPTAKITDENVRGIVELVAGSVEGLKTENIHIIDMQGNSLTDGLKLGDKSAQLAKGTLDRNEVRRNFEKELETRIQAMLRQILGPGMAVAMVTAELDFDQQQYKATTHDKGQVLSEQSITETGTGPGNAGGTPGTDSDLPGQSIPAAGGGGGGSSYSKQEATTNYQVPVKEETVVKAPGGIKRLSVAVVLNGNYSEAQRQQFKNVVATAIGFNSDRGDQIDVVGITFDDTEKKEIGEELAKQKAKEEQRNRVLTIAGLVVFALIALTLLWVYVSRQLRRRAERLAELRRQQEEARKKALLEAEKEEEPEVPKIATRQDEIRDMAVSNPEEVAEILKLWLKE
ncbi:MAG: flagellar M-ring protein FliF [Peptococcaceae bacterium]|nr:flagellar M-ring protein FliF [Peptococcaceae bacterium]